jgi:DNA uptake protein ComE-like DNA-binding protein
MVRGQLMKICVHPKYKSGIGSAPGDVMSERIRSLCFASILVVVLSLGAASCTWSPNGPASDEAQRQRDEKTREDAAKAAERLKPAIESAARKLGEATEQAAEQARAAAKGVKEGWARGEHAPLDLNSASEAELTQLPGITETAARRIIRNRPYGNKQELVTRGIVSRSSYEKIQDQITAK